MHMQKQKLVFRFYNPNEQSDTADAILKLFNKQNTEKIKKQSAKKSSVHTLAANND